MRVSSGVPGLDSLIGGGFMKGSVVLISGGAGTGKTTACMQSLYSAAQAGDKVLFISLDRKARMLKQFFEPMFDLKKHYGKSFLIAETHADSLDTIVKDVEYLTQSYPVQRIAIDPTTILKVQSPSDVRMALNKICSALRKSNCTSLLTTELQDGLEEVLADCIINLEMSRIRGFIARRLTVKKMRGSEHSQYSHPFEITQLGIKVHKSF